MGTLSEYLAMTVAAKPRDLIRNVVSDGVRLGIAFGFAPEVRGVMEEYKGSWSRTRRMYVIDRRRVNGEFAAKLQQAKPANLQFDVKGFADAIKSAIRNPDPDLFVPYLDVQLFPVKGGKSACLFTYDAVLVSVMNSLSGTFLRNRNLWSLPISVDQVLAALEEQGGVLSGQVYLHDTEISLEQLHSVVDADRPSLSVGGSVPAVMMSDGEEQGENQILSVIGQPLATWSVDEIGLAEAAGAYSLYDYQSDGVRHLLRYSSALLADDMGLGKTRQAIVAAHLVSGEGAVLVVCPANLRINWQRQISMVDPQGVVVIDDGSREAMERADWLLASYERLGDMLRRMQELGKVFRVVVYDEVHYLKELGSSRTRNAFLLSQSIPRQFLLTATPVLNREAELHTLLRLGGHPIGQIPLADFLGEFAGSPEMRKALSLRVREWCLRRKKDVLPGLKGKFIQEIRLGLSGVQRERYGRTMGDDSLSPLVKIGRLRQLLEQSKADWLVDEISTLQADDKAIIFCEFTESVSLLAEALRAAGIETVTFTGSDSMKRKQRAVDSFMQEPRVKCFIGTTKAAGVGIDLPCANYVYFASLPWTDAIKRQAEDRAYRNGQTRLVTVRVPIFDETIDERVIELVKYKAGLEEDLFGDDDNLFEGSSNDAVSDEKAEERAIFSLAETMHVSGQKTGAWAI